MQNIGKENGNKYSGLRGGKKKKRVKRLPLFKISREKYKKGDDSQFSPTHSGATN